MAFLAEHRKGALHGIRRAEILAKIKNAIEKLKVSDTDRAGKDYLTGKKIV